MVPTVHEDHGVEPMDTIWIPGPSGEDCVSKRVIATLTGPTHLVCDESIGAVAWLRTKPYQVKHVSSSDDMVATRCCSTPPSLSPPPQK